MSHKSNSLLGFFKGRKSRKACINASENQENENTLRGFSWSPRRGERLSSPVCSLDNDSSCTADKSNSTTLHTENEDSGLTGTVLEFQEYRETQNKLERSLQILRGNYYRDYNVMMQALEEEKLRQDILSKELDGFTELYQNEIPNLREELGSTKEMIRYQVHEATDDIHGMLEALQCRVLKLEEEQLQQEINMKRPQTVLGKMLGHFVVYYKPSGPMLVALLLTAVSLVLSTRIVCLNSSPEWSPFRDY